MVERFTRVDVVFGQAVAVGLGLTGHGAISGTIKKAAQAVGHAVKKVVKRSVGESPALSMENTVKNTIRTRRVAILADQGVNAAELTAVRSALINAGAVTHVIASKLGTLTAEDGSVIEVDQASILVASVLYDAVYIPGGAASVAAMKKLGDPIHFVDEAFRHNKPIGATGEGIELLEASRIKGVTVASVQGAGKTHVDQGVITTRGGNLSAFTTAFIQSIAAHRHWDRPEKEAVPA
jgi:catalase